MTELVILVDSDDRALGSAEKMSVHLDGGRLHRAFSAFIFNPVGQLMLQQRSVRKHHFAGLWSNTCCSHPRPGESVEEAGRRKLMQEMGFATDLTEVLSFEYKAADPASGLTEHEFDHVLFGRHSGEPAPNPDEVDAWRWVSIRDLHGEIQDRPDQLTPWFRIAVRKLTEAGLLVG